MYIDLRKHEEIQTPNHRPDHYANLHGSNVLQILIFNSLFFYPSHIFFILLNFPTYHGFRAYTLQFYNKHHCINLALVHIIIQFKFGIQQPDISDFHYSCKVLDIIQAISQDFTFVNLRLSFNPWEIDNSPSFLDFLPVFLFISLLAFAFAFSSWSFLF